MSWFSKFKQIYLGLMVVLLLTGSAVAYFFFFTKPAATLVDVKLALKEQRFEQGLTLAERIPTNADDFADAWMAVGDHAIRKQRYSEALSAFQRVAESADESALDAQFYAGETLRAMGRLSEAAKNYRTVLKLAPGKAGIHERLAFLLSSTGQNWEAIDSFFFLAKSGKASHFELALLGNFDRPVDQVDLLKSAEEEAPNDIYVRLGLANQAFVNGRSELAENQLRMITSEVPELLPAQAMLGELLTTKTEHEFSSWHQVLPASAEKHPAIWHVRGLWLERQGDFQQAGTCYVKAIEIEPTSRRSIYQLSQVLSHINDPNASVVQEQASHLVELTQTLDSILKSDGNDIRSIKRTVLLLEKLGRIWEACAWASLVRNKAPNQTWTIEILAKHLHTLKDPLPRVRSEFDLSQAYVYSELKPYTGFDIGSDIPAEKLAHSDASSPIQFEEQTGLIDFVYKNGEDPKTKGARQLEQTGGGIAVLDYDLNGTPDLFLPQGGTWVSGAKQASIKPEEKDSLYRNSPAGDFGNVTLKAMPEETSFGQGCSVGDFNSDGFPDLYVANIGQNRLYENQGDGTFLDVTEAMRSEHQEWTTSTIMVDLNEDSHPDIIDVNYVRGPEVYTKICNGQACSPKVFEGCPDRLLISNGDGSFLSLPIDSATQNSKGLGIITVPGENPLRPGLFIANDQVANFMLKNTPSENNENIQLQDEAFLRGVAFDRDGMAMACMGIAADDIDGDGTTDLFVTNFQDESNTLYLQRSAGLFDDVTITYQLRAASLPYVGWGTQFLDANLDGHADVAVTNGHVDDYRNSGGMYHMPPQIFRNNGLGAFIELSSEEVGEFVDRKLVGRSMVRLDWNQDGLMDLAISCINEPLALLKNSSPDPGHYLNFKVHGTASSRDAIGTRIVVKSYQNEWTKTLLAGDGYMASNERILQFGLGDITDALEVIIQWPSGTKITLQEVPYDVTIELSEKHTVGTLWKKGKPQSFQFSDQAGKEAQ